MALACTLGGAALGLASGPVSPYASPVDLGKGITSTGDVGAGRYMATSPGVSSDGLAMVTTATSGANVTEISAGVLAQQNTFTPYSDAFKKPLPQSVDLRGHSVSADIDMGNPSEWDGTTGSEAFFVGQGTSDGSAGPASGGVFIELRHIRIAGVDHVQVRLVTSGATGAWMDTGVFGAAQVAGTLRCRIDVNAAGNSATMTVTPAPTLVPPPTGIYTDITDTQPCAVTGAAPFAAGFWSSGVPGTVRGAARLVRMTTNASAGSTLSMMSVTPYITSAIGTAAGATAPQSTEFHLVASTLSDLIRGYQASGIYFGTVAGYFIFPMNMDPSSIQNQSYTNSVAGPFVYLLSPYIFTTTLFDQIVGGPYGFANFRIAAGSPPATPSLNTDAELAALPVGPVIPDGTFGQSGGNLNVQLVGTDPDGILGVTGFALENGIVQTANIRGSDIVLCDEVRPVANLSGGGVTEGLINLIPTVGTANAVEGTVDVNFFAEDLGDFADPTGSGLGTTPKAIIQMQDPSSGVFSDTVNLVVFPSSVGDNHFHGSWVIGVDTPCGTYRVRLEATDRVGLVSSLFVTKAFTVHTLVSVTVNLSLGGLVGNPNANNQRLIEFQFGSAQGTVVPPGGSSSPKTVIDKLVRFANGQASVTFSFPDIPNCDARNLVIWAKDLQHTIAASAGPFNGIVGSVFVVNLTLLAGDVNNDNVVNFTDYALFVADYGMNAPKDMTSLIFYRNCDFNGSGQVDFADWILFFPDYSDVGAAMPGNFVRAFAILGGTGTIGDPGDVNIHDPHLTRMPVRQLVKLGVTDAPKWDLNHDGWIDMSELYKAMQSKGGR